MRRDLFYRLKKRSGSFTLVELLVVIAVILILAGLGLSAGEGVMNRAERSRTRAEIQAMAAALESYKADNGIYPSYDIGLTTNNYVSADGTVGSYQNSSELLYQSLAGKTNFTDTTNNAGKIYMSFKADQVGNNTAGLDTYVQDAFGYSYGYNTGSTSTHDVPYNGWGFYDLWSTGGALSSATPPTNAAWISNWAQ
jgi:prepilin-type N-terminal cleavage/methylation domain-containing protein